MFSILLLLHFFSSFISKSSTVLLFLLSFTLNNLSNFSLDLNIFSEFSKTFCFLLLSIESSSSNDDISLFKLSFSISSIIANYSLLFLLYILECILLFWNLLLIYSMQDSFPLKVNLYKSLFYLFAKSSIFTFVCFSVCFFAI